MTVARTVWKNSESRRIGKSLKMKLGLGDDVKGQGFLMMYTWCAHVQQRLRI